MILMTVKLLFIFVIFDAKNTHGLLIDDALTLRPLMAVT